GGPLLAAVDGSEPSVLALRFAADEARRRGRTLDVVHVTAEGGEATGRRLLDDLLGAVPDLPPLRRRVLAGSPAGELVRASRRAGLIALGAARVGAVARELLQHSACPTVFVHGRKERPLSLPRVATVSKG
ncbi:universal stress protein, partial [Actinoplanes siamensis]